MHLMIDLETLSLDKHCVIMEFGFAEFHLDAFGIIRSGGIFLDREEQVNSGRKISTSTISWWMQQSQEARNRMSSSVDHATIHEFFHWMTSTLKWEQYEGVWSHGLNFDLCILEDLYAQSQIKVPWHYRLPRDTRTLFALANFSYKGTKHTAIEDAREQAVAVQQAYAKLKGTLP